MKFTDAQIQAIDVNQHNILVNAAAGSGKTAVLVERLFQRLLAGATLDSFIVITFTKLAASEMKERLAERLHEELLTLDSESELYAHLLYVESQIPTSHISTIDAFCSFVVREYGYVLPQVTKRLSLIDSVEAKQIDEDTFLELADTILTTPEYLAVASEYIDIQDVSNQKLLQILQTIAPEFAQVADYRNRYEQLQFACKPITNVEELSLFPKFVQRQSYILSEIDAGVLKSFHYSDRYDADIKKITEFIEQLSVIVQNNRTYEEIQKGIQSLQFPRKPAIPKDEQDEEKEALYKKQRDLIKK
ncbi:MAG: UvrD-helicase domain-containing protein, partial [Culicoidibacterales bacterium]